MSRSSISLQKLGVKIGSHNILSNVDLRCEAGERIAMLGASGSGKTTLLRAIAGLETRISNGRIELDGHEVNGPNTNPAPPHTRGVSMLFQDLALWPHMTAHEHLAFALAGTTNTDTNTKPDAKANSCRIHKSLEAVRLDNRHAALPSQLSGGERQRLALARALIINPARLLLDEPFASLDLPLRHEMVTLLLALHATHNFTLIHVTHDPIEAIKIGTRIVVLEAGSVAWTGATTELPAAEVPAAKRIAVALEAWLASVDR